MTVNFNLNDRYQNILKAAIRHYIATAEPVGSKTLLEEYNFSVSSATIRNALGKLEKEGLLYQPHTSSGRVPSDNGYRVYVNELMIPDERVGKKINRYLKQEIKPKTWSFEALLQKATHLLAGFSGYIAVVTLPNTHNRTLRHLQLIGVSGTRVMLIIVTDDLQTRSVMIEAPPDIENGEWLEEDLQMLSNFLNEKLKGYSLLELSLVDRGEIDRSFTRYTHFLKQLIREVGTRLKDDRTPSFIVHGVAEVLRQPEFSQLPQVQMLLHLLEDEQEQLFPLLSEPSTDRVKITIGSENPLESMRPCTLVSSIYKKNEIPVGCVGIIGPTRMLYENTIPLVESTADYLTETISR